MVSPEVARSGLLAELNRAITDYQDLIAMYVKRFHEKTDLEYETCRLEEFRKNSRSVRDPVGMERLGEAFLVLTYCMVICVGVFVAENWVHWWGQFRRYTFGVGR